METMTVREVVQKFAVSNRMLRYYEKMGLISSLRIENYAYRVYDLETIKRLQQILVLRKLRIPVKQIAIILDDAEQKLALAILQENVTELEEEISALHTVRNVLKLLVSKLDESMQKKVRLDLLGDEELMEVVRVLNPSKTNLKEERAMNELEHASKVLDSKMDIRIVYLPPATVAASQYTGENPEDTAGKRIYDFIRAANLPMIKPDFRVYGFNNPSPQEGQKEYGYEFWVTIPDKMKIPAPLEKKTFTGGLYAAHCIQFGNFYEWGTFVDKMKQNNEYEIDWRAPEGMGGCLEEELNIYTHLLNGDAKTAQLDLLLPIKRRNEA